MNDAFDSGDDVGVGDDLLRARKDRLGLSVVWITTDANDVVPPLAGTVKNDGGIQALAAELGGAILRKIGLFEGAALNRKTVVGP